MSNLGLYKTMTVAAHAVGGPVMLALGVMAAGYFLGKKIEKELCKKENNYAKYGNSTKIH